jgi:hypothetical protein
MSDSITFLTPFALARGGVATIQSLVSCVDQNRLQITYMLNGVIRTLKVPDKGSSRRVDRLWEHTCFEAFIRVDGDPSYYEFNFSPSTEWAAYWFRNYRDGGPMPDETCAPEILVRRDVDRIELAAIVHLDQLPAIPLGATLRIGLSAVIEADDGTLSYWAIKHPAPKPDFHHYDSFALELALPSQRT